MTRLGACLRRVTGSGAAERLEQERLLAHAIGRDRVFLHTHPEHRLSCEEARRHRRLRARRAAGEPLAYILGKEGFRELELTVTPAVLVPRPETELLVELALRRLGRTATVLDLGTGSGAIALALAHERPDCTVTASDVSQAALAVAAENAQRLRLPLRLLCSDWFEAIAGRFDAIVANPPYIADHDPHLSSPELLHEPAHALRGGADGLAASRIIIDGAWRHLRDRGWLILEHGHDQAEAARRMIRMRGYRAIETFRDLAGLERATLGCRGTATGIDR